MTHRISGYYCTDGFVDGRGEYLVVIEGGRIFEAHGFGEELFVRQYGADRPILTNGCWEFWPDADELTRLGIVPTQMILEG